jgi:hypothetical protein
LLLGLPAERYPQTIDVKIRITDSLKERTVKAFETNFRLMAVLILVLVVLGFAPQTLRAQTVSASPVALSYGVPTGTPVVAPCTVPCSATESLTVNIVGASPSTPVAFGATTVTGTNSGDFIVAGDSCSEQTFTAAATCQVSVYFNASLAPFTTLETATLTVSVATSNIQAPPPVPLSGAYGAIKLWNETNVTTSATTPPNPTSFTNMYTIASQGLNLSCPTSPTVAPTATLSNTPDGNGYVLVDNYITVSVNGVAVNNGVAGNNPLGNVCSGGPSDSSGGIAYNDCFSTNYQVPAGTNYSLNGQDPDTFTNPGNPLLFQQSGNPNNAGGLPPINLSSFFPAGAVQATFTALDSGYVYDTSTVFLQTNCTPGGIIPGGTTTGNPTPTNTVSFDSNPGANLSITDDTAQNPPATGTVPMYTQIAVPQQLFYQLVAGTSAAPDVCLRAASEQDTANNNAPMCVGILIQCYDPVLGTTSGNNCDSSTPVGLRDLYDTVQFASPDAPVNGTNFLYGPGTTGTDACTYYLANPNNNTAKGTVPYGACATGTGASVLMGGDNWLCGTGDYPPTPCTPLEPNSSTGLMFNTSTPYTESVYSEGNDGLGGGLTGDLSPLGTLTNFQGAADGSGGSSVPLKNSVLFLVANHPLPTETAIIAGQNSNGWINGTTINATFTSGAASYSPGSTNPPSNGFIAASPYSLTYGISNYPALPDSTYPVTGDATNYNTTVSPNLGASGTSWIPLCPAGVATPGSFTSYATSDGTQTGTPTLTGLSNGIYNVHYFTTDCALTEGLVFNPTTPQLTNPTANWASFPFVSVGVDTTAPALSCSTSQTPVNGWYNSNVVMNCSATDVGSGFSPGTPVSPGSNVLQGSLATSFNASTGVLANTANPAAGIAVQQISDLAGNLSNTQGPYTFAVDLQAPMIAGPALSPAVSGNKYVVGSTTTVTITYSCNDGVGSGVASCTEVGALPSGTTTNCTPKTPAASGVPVTCTSSFAPAPTNVGSYSIYVSATDNVGHPATSSTVSFSVGDAPSTVIVGAFPAQAVTPGSNLTYYVGAADTDLPKTVSIYGATINVTLKIPTNTLATGTATAISDDVTCSSWPCSVMPTTGPACTVTPSSVTSATTAVNVSCSVGTIPDIFTSRSAAIVKIVLPTSTKAPAGTISTSGTITATTPLSGITSFTSSVSIK